MLLRALIILSLSWIILLVTGYGLLTASEENALGLGLKCQYLTGRGLVNTQYLHTENEVVGHQRCPWLKKT